ncbi:hypothetical protein IMX17_19045 [Serratia sp. X3]|uniref:hypothetical protein n=1 Tax=Serratia sp. X3 TaxID=2780495 RepID=UPI001876AFC3|nr:hypothetical protein [Serratia sp. X3]MBE4975477.1 hypothetical protein [Serratia sp. X3]
MMVHNEIMLMWEKIKDNYIRVLYIIASVSIVYVCYIYQSDIISKNENMSMFSYYASVATVVALLISIMEIFYNISITKSIESRSQSYLAKFKDTTGLSFAHECVSYYDQCLNDLATKKYPILVANFTIAKKLHISLANYFMAEEDKKEFDDKKKSLNELENKILSMRHVNASSSLGNAQVKEIRDALLEVRQGFETKYTFRRTEG